jgi:hypothetical protein
LSFLVPNYSSGATSQQPFQWNYFIDDLIGSAILALISAFISIIFLRIMRKNKTALPQTLTPTESESTEDTASKGFCLSAILKLILTIISTLASIITCPFFSSYQHSNPFFNQYFVVFAVGLFILSTFFNFMGVRFAKNKKDKGLYFIGLFMNMVSFFVLGITVIFMSALYNFHGYVGINLIKSGYYLS